jgi:hypothetical protein
MRTPAKRADVCTADTKIRNMIIPPISVSF